MKTVREERWALVVAFAAIAVVFCIAVATMPATAEGEESPHLRGQISEG